MEKVKQFVLVSLGVLFASLSYMIIVSVTEFSRQEAARNAVVYYQKGYDAALTDLIKAANDMDKLKGSFSDPFNKTPDVFKGTS